MNSVRLSLSVLPRLSLFSFSLSILLGVFSLMTLLLSPRAAATFRPLQDQGLTTTLIAEGGFGVDSPDPSLCGANLSTHTWAKIPAEFNQWLDLQAQSQLPEVALNLEPLVAGLHSDGVTKDRTSSPPLEQLLPGYSQFKLADPNQGPHTPNDVFYDPSTRSLQTHGFLLTSTAKARGTSTLDALSDLLMASDLRAGDHVVIFHNLEVSWPAPEAQAQDRHRTIQQEAPRHLVGRFEVIGKAQTPSYPHPVVLVWHALIPGERPRVEILSDVLLHYFPNPAAETHSGEPVTRLSFEVYRSPVLHR